MSTLGILPPQASVSKRKTTNPIPKSSFRSRSPSVSAASSSPPYPPLVLRRSETLSPAEESSSVGFGRREIIGLSTCLNSLFLFRGVAIADEGVCSFTVTPSGLAYCDKVVGSGEAAAKGQLIKAHYVGKLEDGKVFDSSYSRGKPLTFRVGVGEVIKGWDQGILGDEGIPPMLSGGKRTLKIPPELAYGARGAGCRGGSCIIPPGATLSFEVEFIGKA